MIRIDNADRSDGRTGLVVFVSVLGLVGALTILVVSWNYGLGTSIDGVVYLGSAQNLLDGHGLSDLRGHPLVIFPPLFPTLIAAIGLLTGSVGSAAILLQIAVYAGNFVLIAIILSRFVTRRLLVVFLVAVLVSRTFLLYHYFVLSDALFVFFSLSMLLCLGKWTVDRIPKWIIAAAVFAALSCLTRYVGIANVLAGVIVVFLSERTWQKRIRASTLFSVLAVAPLALWLARNAISGGSLTGNRLPSPYPLSLNVKLIIDGIALWFVPDEVYPAVRQAAVVLAVIFGLVVIFRWKGTEAARSSFPPSLLTSFVAAHLLVLLVSITVFASDYINTRFVMPVYVPMIICAAYVTATLVSAQPKTRPIALALLSLWIAVQSITAVRSFLTRAEDGVGGFTTRAWYESGVMDYVKSHRTSFVGHDMYSNAGVAVYHHSGVFAEFFPDRLNPRWEANYPKDVLENRLSVTNLMTIAADSNRSVVLIWFDAFAPDPKYESIFLFNQYGLDDIRELFRVDPIAEFDDGGVYDLRLPVPAD